MGEDKSLLSYHGKPQCYYVYEMLQQFCESVFISCNAKQAPSIQQGYNVIEDDAAYANRGPATGVLSAFSKHSGSDLLVVGCDYPYLTMTELRHFLTSIPGNAVAAAFFDERDQCYQPVLAWYSAKAGDLLAKSPQTLKRLLESVNAYKHFPLNYAILKSVDTKEEREAAMYLTNDNQ